MHGNTTDAMTTEIFMRYATSALLLCLLTTLSHADVRPVGIFKNHMVLQRNMQVPIWGTASAGEKVTVSIAGQEAETTANDEGRWMVKLNPMEAGGPYEMIIIGNNTLKIKDVLVGEVWFCSGQSNMAMKLEEADHGVAAATDAPGNRLRRFKIRGDMPDEPSNKISGQWQKSNPRDVLKWSAAAYFFGMDLQRELDVPVALIECAVGWTPAEAWIGREALESDPKLKPIMERWDHPDAPQHQHHATLLYNGMVAPLMPYAIRGVIWYQGETNAPRADQYRTLFPALIHSWRKSWGQGDFPFLYVQIAPLNAGPIDRAELRDAQRETLSLPNTAMVVTLDIGEEKDEHPPNKKDVGHRLALAAFNLVYDQDVVYSGPLYKDMKIQGNTIRLTFDHVGGGLIARGGTLKGFTIAGADQKFVPAQAKILGDTIVVSSPDVRKPIAVRYCFQNWPGEKNVTLFNKAGLPASSFRTDDWPLSTKGNTKMLF